jgi:hypothetical protein
MIRDGDHEGATKEPSGIGTIEGIGPASRRSSSPRSSKC